MPFVEPKMTTTQMASLLDAAFRVPHPQSFLDVAVTTFGMLGRRADATTTAWIGCLHAEGEVEVLQGLRAAWRRGEERSPADAARLTVRWRS